MESRAPGAGTLYLVATPIGNLEDLSPRARRILGEVAAVAAEDTRRTRTLLAACDLHTPLISLHEHNELARIPALLERLRAGEDLALVSDAGAPTISDPGMPLARAAAEAGIAVVPIPGPSAVIAALMAAGLPTDRFLFLGFPPAKAARRERLLSSVAAEPGCLVLFEGKSRIVKLLEAVGEILGPRRVAVARELTKRHEEVLRGSPAEVIAQLEAAPEILGEPTVVIEGARGDVVPAATQAPGEAQGVKELAAEVARVMGIKRDAYQALLALKGGGEEG